GLGRRVRDLARDGGRVHHADPPRRRAAPAPGRPGRDAVLRPGMSDDGAAVARLVTAVATDLLEARDELNRLDGVAGDGDLGLTVTNASRALLELAPSLGDLAEADAIRRCGTEIARKAPSTGGTLIAFALMAAAKAGVDPEAAAVDLDAAARTIAERGNVAAGDRTMLDALRPAADAVLGAAAAGTGNAEA